jgi:RNA polymerase sigma factor (sigma-70 family)
MQNRDRRARLTDWFREWRTPLRRFLVLRSVRPADLDDVAQEVFLRLLRYERSELVEHPQAYLFKMASNVAAERSMRASYRRPHDAKWLAYLRAGPDQEPEEAVARAAAQQHLRAALARLAPRPREVLRLHFGDNLSHAEIAQRLGVTPRIVKRDLINAYARLRVELNEEIVESLRVSIGGSDEIA